MIGDDARIDQRLPYFVRFYRALNDEAKRDLTGLARALLKLKEISPSTARLAARIN